MSKIHKHTGIDKFDAYLPNKSHFIQDEYYTSRWSESFHMDSSWGYRERQKGFSFGVNKRKTRVSSLGICVDSNFIGKTGNS